MVAVPELGSGVMAWPQAASSPVLPMLGKQRPLTAGPPGSKAAKSAGAAAGSAAAPPRAQPVQRPVKAALRRDSSLFELPAAATKALMDSVDLDDPRTVHLRSVSQQRHVLRGFKKAWECTVEAESRERRLLYARFGEVEDIESRSLVRRVTESRFNRHQLERIQCLQQWWRDLKAGRVGRKALRGALFTLRYKMAQHKVLRVRSLCSEAARELEIATEEDHLRGQTYQSVAMEVEYMRQRGALSDAEEEERGRYHRQWQWIVQQFTVRRLIEDLRQNERHRRAVILRDVSLAYDIIFTQFRMTRLACSSPKAMCSANTIADWWKKTKHRASLAGETSRSGSPVAQLGGTGGTSRSVPMNRSMALASLLSSNSALVQQQVPPSGMGPLMCSSYQVAHLYGRVVQPPQSPLLSQSQPQIIADGSVAGGSPTTMSGRWPHGMDSHSLLGSPIHFGNSGTEFAGSMSVDFTQPQKASSFYGEPVTFSVRRSLCEFPFQGYRHGDEVPEVEQYKRKQRGGAVDEESIDYDEDDDDYDGSERRCSSIEREREMYLQSNRRGRVESITTMDTSSENDSYYSETPASLQGNSKLNYAQSQATDTPAGASLFVQPSMQPTWKPQRPHTCRTQRTGAHNRAKPSPEERSLTARSASSRVRSSLVRVGMGMGVVAHTAPVPRFSPLASLKRGLNDTCPPGPTDPCAIAASWERAAPHQQHFYFGDEQQRESVRLRLQHKRNAQARQHLARPPQQWCLPQPPSQPKINYRYPPQSPLTNDAASVRLCHSPELAPPRDPHAERIATQIDSLLYAAEQTQQALLREHAATILSLCCLCSHEALLHHTLLLSGCCAEETHQRSQLLRQHGSTSADTLHDLRRLQQQGAIGSLATAESAARLALDSEGCATAQRLLSASRDASTALLFQGRHTATCSEEADNRDDMLFSEANERACLVATYLHSALKACLRSEVQARQGTSDAERAQRRELMGSHTEGCLAIAAADRVRQEVLLPPPPPQPEDDLSDPERRQGNKVPHHVQVRVFINRESDRRDILADSEAHHFGVVVEQWHAVVDEAYTAEIAGLQDSEGVLREALGREAAEGQAGVDGAIQKFASNTEQQLLEHLTDAVTLLERGEANGRGDIRQAEDADRWFAEDLFTSPGLLSSEKIEEALLRDESGTRLAITQYEGFDFARLARSPEGVALGVSKVPRC